MLLIFWCQEQSSALSSGTAILNISDGAPISAVQRSADRPATLRAEAQLSNNLEHLITGRTHDTQGTGGIPINYWRTNLG